MFASSRVSRSFLALFIASHVLFFLITFARPAMAAAIVWDNSGGDGLWGSCTNWVGNACPGASDVATFDPLTSTASATINAAFAGSVGGVNIMSGYTGTITQARSLTVGSSGWTQADGIFTGATQSIDLNGPFTLSGGTFTSTTGAFTISGNYTHTAGGTFSPSTGTVTFDGSTAGAVADVNATETFYNLTINKSGASSNAITVSSGDTLTATNTLTLTNGNINTGTVRTTGTISDAVGFDGGTGQVEIAAAITWDPTTITPPGITLNHAGAVLTGPAVTVTMTVEGDVNIQAGTWNAGAGDTVVVDDWTLAPGATFNHDSGRVFLTGADVTMTGSTTFNDLMYDTVVDATLTLESGSTTTILDQAYLSVESAGQPTGNILTIQSSTPGVQATIDPQSANVSDRNFHDVTIQDVENADATDIYCRIRCTDAGNNTGFLFGEPGVDVSEFSLETSEAGTTADFTVVLRNQPTNNVTISVTSGDEAEVTVSDASLTFTSGNWDTPQTITVTGVNDLLDDGATDTLISLGNAVSVDTAYSGMIVPDVTVRNIDNDAGTLTFDFDTSANWTEEDVTGATITTFSPLVYGIGNLLDGTLTEVDISGTKIQAGCKITIGGDVYTIVNVLDPLLGSIVISEDPGQDPRNYDGILIEDTVDAISCVDMDEDTGGLNTDFIGARVLDTITVSSNMEYDTTEDALFIPVDGTLTRVDLTTEAVVSTVGGSGVIDDATIDPTRGYVWMVNSSDDTITVFDTATGDYAFGNLVASTFAVGDQPIASAYDSANDVIWVLESGTTDQVRQLNAATGADEGTFAVSSTNDASSSNLRDLAYDVSNDALWIVVEDGLALVKLDAFSGAPFDTDIDTSTYRLQFSSPDVSSAAIPVYDAVEDAVWVLNGQCDSGTDDFVAKVRASDGVVLGQYPVPSCPEDIELSGDYLYVTSDSAGSITQLRRSDGVRIESHGSNEASYPSAVDSDGDVWVGDLFNDLVIEHVDEGVPTNAFYTVVTKDAAQLDTAAYDTVDNVTVTETLDGGEIYYAVSFDARASFKVFGSWRTIASSLAADHGGVDGNWYYRDDADVWTADPNNTPASAISNAIEAGPVNNRMDGVVLDGLTDADWALAGGFSDSVNTLDLSATFYSVDAHDNPQVDAVAFSLSSSGGSPGVTVTESAASTDVTEGGATDTYDVVLDTMPTDDVTITVSPDGQCTTDETSLVFTDLNWNIAQTVTVTAVNDDIDEASPHSCVITQTAASADVDYNAIAVTDITADVTDNDTAGVTVSLISGNTTEAGGTATFTVVLDSEPTGNVEVDSASNDSTEGTVTSGGTLTFTTGNWDTPQTVTVTGVNDDLDDGDIAYVIVVDTDDANTADAAYDAIDPNDVSVTNTDNDTAGVTVSVISGNTTEAGGTATFTVVLDTEPTGDVVIDVASSNAAEGTANVASLTFTTLNWFTEQTVTVTGVDDLVDDGNVVYSIELTTDVGATADMLYDAIDPDDVAVTNTDNDSSGGGGGGGSSGVFVTGGSVSIAGGASCVASPNVTLSLAANNADDMLVSNQSNLADASWESYASTKSWVLDATDGSQTVYVRYRSVSGNTTTVYTDSITLDQETDCSGPIEVPSTPPDESSEEPTETPSSEVEPGEFVRSEDGSTIYFVDSDGALRPFSNFATYLTYVNACTDFDYVTEGVLESAALGLPMMPAPGSVLVKFSDSPRVYAVEANPDPDLVTLRWIESERVAELVYGVDWNEYVIEITRVEGTYVIGGDVIGTEPGIDPTNLKSRASLTGGVSYNLYIINPDGTRRDAFSSWTRAVTNADGTLTFNFEDKGSDFDFNDVVVEVDGRSCTGLIFRVRPLEASWHHQIGIEIFYEGERKDDVLLWTDSHAAVNEEKTLSVTYAPAFEASLQTRYAPSVTAASAALWPAMRAALDGTGSLFL